MLSPQQLLSRLDELGIADNVAARFFPADLDPADVVLADCFAAADRTGQDRYLDTAADRAAKGNVPRALRCRCHRQRGVEAPRGIVEVHGCDGKVIGLAGGQLDEV